MDPPWRRERRPQRDARGRRPREFEARTGVADGAQPAFATFVRDTFGPRARALGFRPKAGEGDDDQLMRRVLLRFAAPYDPACPPRRAGSRSRGSAIARRSRRCWSTCVLVTAARTGDAALFDAFLAAAKSTPERDVRASLLLALFTFEDRTLADRGLALLLDPSFDVREAWNTVWYASKLLPMRRATTIS
jgi:hypothetical protein